jgi:hypothetical protein
MGLIIFIEKLVGRKNVKRNFCLSIKLNDKTITISILFCKIKIIRIKYLKKQFGQNKIKFFGFNKSPYFCF